MLRESNQYASSEATDYQQHYADDEHGTVSSKDNSFPWSTLMIGGVAAFAAYWIFFKKTKAANELTEDQKKLMDDVLKEDFDPVHLLPEDETPFSISWSDDETDYDSCLQAAADFKQSMTEDAKASLANVARIDSAQLAKLLYIAGDSDTTLYPTLMNLYLQLLDIWTITTRPLVESSTALMTTAVKYMGDAIDRSLQPAEIVFLKDVSSYASFSEVKSVTAINKKSGAGLLNFGSFNILGGQTQSKETITQNKAKTEASMDITWVPHVTEYQIDADIYALALKETEAIAAVAMAQMAAAIEAAPSLDSLLIAAVPQT